MCKLFKRMTRTCLSFFSVLVFNRVVDFKKVYRVLIMSLLMEINVILNCDGNIFCYVIAGK